MPGQSPRMFAKTAAFYDRVYAALGKDYVREANALAVAIRRHAPEARTLLDAGCGTGAHLEAFEHDGFVCGGFDLDLTMVKLARARCPGMEIVPGDLIDFAPGERFDFTPGARFDVVTCLFAAISYVRTAERLRKAIANLATLLAPGGQLVLEPQIGPAEFKPGRLDAVFVDEPDLKLARMSVSKQIGKIAIIDFHYMIATRKDGVEREFERHEIGLFEPAEYHAAFTDAGLTCETLELPEFPRGILRGVPARA